MEQNLPITLNTARTDSQTVTTQRAPIAIQGWIAEPPDIFEARFNQAMYSGTAPDSEVWIDYLQTPILASNQQTTASDQARTQPQLDDACSLRKGKCVALTSEYIRTAAGQNLEFMCADIVYHKGSFLRKKDYKLRVLMRETANCRIRITYSQEVSAWDEQTWLAAKNAFSVEGVFAAV